MSEEPADYFRYWGKTFSPEGGPVTWHLLPYHCLDVAAVGQVLLSRHGRARTLLAELVHLDEAVFSQIMVFLLALHDLGKFAESFQNLQPAVLKQLQDKSSKKTYSARHDTLGFLVWGREIKKSFLENGLLLASGTTRRQSRDTPYDYWMRAITGHHGQPPKEKSDYLHNDFSQADLTAAHHFVQATKNLLLDSVPVLPTLDTSRLRTASWWLAGFTVLCDWLGSNTAFFQPHPNREPLDEYWRYALRQAEKAIDATELIIESCQSETTLQQLFKNITELTPLQVTCGNISLTHEPQLIILEDVTGAGKTEAAVLIAHRLMAKHAGSGLYFALPTMATANAMYDRMKEVYRRLYPENVIPSLVLAHSARNLSDSFRETILPVGALQERPYGDETTSASAHCGAWLADNAKKAFLAAVGVGTVDQALLGILPSRHQCLRLFGLMDKILIIDEVHACDEYMHTLLKSLLQAHAMAGGSVVLLSATLPNQQRQALLDAFSRGKGEEPRTIERTGTEDYPLLTHLNQAGLMEIPVETRASVIRRVNVELISDVGKVETILKDAVMSGRCACWIRNTVADAREAYQSLRSQHPDWAIELFHARFALGDRLAIENRVVERFGWKSSASVRMGRVLIATQVVEQSLDIDFDVMITDLAPVDLIIQRAGRLCRHQRTAAGDRHDGPDQRGTPTLHMFTPLPIDEPDWNWYSTHFPRGAFVYSNHGQLWLTARMLQTMGGFSVPDDVRRLTESVFGETLFEDIPAGIERRMFESEGKALADASVARLNTLKLAEGYAESSANHWWDEARTPTRLGDPTTTVYLARWDGEQLLPWAHGQPYAWHQSSVQIRTFHIALEAPESGLLTEAITRVKEELPAGGKWGVLVPMRRLDENTWTGRAVNEKNEVVSVYYDAQTGLMMEKERNRLSEEANYESD